MKKGFLIAAMVLGTVATFAQTKSVEVSKFKTGTGALTASHKFSVNLESGDTTRSYVYIGFRNSKYTTIVDIVSYMFSTQEELDEFTKALKAALPEIKTKSTIHWKKRGFHINVYDFTNTLYMNEVGGSGDAQFTPKQVEKMIAWLETVKL